MRIARGIFWLAAARRGQRPLGPIYATELDISMMRRALALAGRAARAGEVPVGAVVYRGADGVVVGEGSNTREQEQNPAGHAEHAAITRAAKRLGSWRLDGCTLVVTLEPCAMCAGLIVNARVGRVVYGASDPKAGYAGSLSNLLTDARLNHRVRPIAGVLEEECADVLKRFFRSLRDNPR